MKIESQHPSSVKSVAAITSNKTEPTLPASAGVADGAVFIPTAAISLLVQQLQKLPETRVDLVRQVREQLAKGDLLTPIAAAETAQAIVGLETTGG